MRCLAPGPNSIGTSTTLTVDVMDHGIDIILPSNTSTLTSFRSNTSTLTTSVGNVSTIAHAHAGANLGVVIYHYLIFPWTYSSHNPRGACIPTSRYSHFPIYTIPYILTSFQLPHFPPVDLNSYTTITNNFLFLINA